MKMFSSAPLRVSILTEQGGASLCTGWCMAELLQAQPVAGKIDFSSSGGADAMASRFRPVPFP